MKDAADLRIVLVFAALVAALFAKGLVTELPPLRAESPPGVFDATRAKERLARILGDERPHPVDSDANDAVRARLLAEVEALGFHPEVRDDFACNARFARITCARVRNVLFQIGPEAGPNAGKATMIASHYDSVPAGPGAGDDGIGVAASLEIAALLAEKPPERPVLFLITDGEETGLIGAKSFVDVDPLTDGVERVINLEARGVRGPAQMFQTAEPNGTDVAIFAAGAGRPVSNSMMTDVYRLLPNDTDLTEFLPLGYGALNIALTEGVELYHTPGDNLAALDARSLQHMGDLALASLEASLARDEGAGGGRVIFTDIASRAFLVLPQWTGAAILALGFLLSLLAFARAGGPRPLRALLAAPVGLFLAGALAFALQYAIGLMRPGALYWFAHPEGAQGLSYLAAALGVLLGAGLLARGAAARRLAAANWAWFAAFGLAAYAVAPGASILFALPVAVFAVGALAGLLSPAAERAFALLGAVSVLIMFAPTLFLAEVGLGFAILAIPALVAALLFLVWTPMAFIGDVRIGRASLAAAAGALLAAVAVTLAAPAYSPAKPRPLSIQYYIDADTGEARWLIASIGEPAPEEMANVADFARAEIEALGAERLVAPAPYLETEAPRLEILSDRPVADGRRVTVRLISAGADQFVLRFPEEAGATSIVAAGRETAFSGEMERILLCTGRACDGAEFEISLGAGEPVEATLVGVHYGLPFAAAALVSARPDWATPIQNGDVSIVSAKARL